MLEPGAIVAERFRIRRKLGEGGMGAVYECEHVKVGKRYAIKVLDKRDSLPPEAIERFDREASAPSKIGHPNIVDVFDVGVEPNGTPWMVMELLEGETLGDVIKREQVVQPAKLAAIMDQLLDCLAAMHAAGFVHRDLKPANIFLLGDRPTVKLLDFGIAKAVGEDSRTRSGYVIGTPAYMAPEQMRNARAATARSDLWSVGVLLYECLVGFRPFRGETFALLAQIAGPGSHARLADIAADLPKPLANLVDRCLSKDPTQRPASATTLREELVPLLESAGRVRPLPPPVDPEEESSSYESLAHSDTSHQSSASQSSKPANVSGRNSAVRSSDANGSAPVTVVRGIEKSSGKTMFFATVGVLAVGALGIGGYLATRSPPPERPISNPPRTHRDGGPNEPRPNADGTFALSSNGELSQLLQRWEQAIVSTRGRIPVEKFYAEIVQFHGSNVLGSREHIRTYWRQLMTTPGTELEFDWSRSRYRERNPELSERVPASCINAVGATGKIFDVRAQAREVRVDRNPDIGCQELRGVYLIRLRRIAGELRICHETWSLPDGICASCPTARVCQGSR
jgi:serine/threonine protein kinase